MTLNYVFAIYEGENAVTQTPISLLIFFFVHSV